MNWTMKFRIPTRSKLSDLGVKLLSWNGRTLTLFPGEDLPPRRDHIVQNLQTQVYQILLVEWFHTL